MKNEWAGPVLEGVESHIRGGVEWAREWGEWGGASVQIAFKGGIWKYYEMG